MTPGRRDAFSVPTSFLFSIAEALAGPLLREILPEATTSEARSEDTGHLHIAACLDK
jgi:hypothetical protein